MQTTLMILEKTGLIAMIASMSVAATAFSHGSAGAGLCFLVAGGVSLLGAAWANYNRVG